MAKNYVASTGLPWPLLLDHDRELYRGYGLESGSWWQIYNPISILRYIFLILRKRNIGKPGSDYRQLGGDVLVDPDGIVRMHIASETPHDRPSVPDILAVVDQHATDTANPGSQMTGEAS